MAEINFDANSVDPQSNFDPVPANQYLVMVVDSTIGPNSKNSGQLMKLTYEVIEPAEYKGRKIFQNINVQHQNKTAEEIGQRQLSAICHATGAMNITDTVELHNLPLGVKVIIDEQPGYSPKNEVKGYYNADGSEVKGNGEAAAPAATQAQPAATEAAPVAEQAAPAATGGSKPPWQR